MDANKSRSPDEKAAGYLRAALEEQDMPEVFLIALRNAAEASRKRELARKCGMPQPHIAAMESGKRTIGLTVAKKLGLALGVDYRKLFIDAEWVRERNMLLIDNT